MQKPQAEIPALKNGDVVAPDMPPVGEPASVLIVDDNQAMLESLAAVVTEMGLQVVAVKSGREALRQLLLKDFALILLDVNMPDMDGFETAALIHGRPRSAHLPIIFVTAEAQGESDRFRGYNMGAVDFIYSPILPDVLRAKVQVFANIFDLNRQLRQQTEDLRQRSDEIGRKNQQLEQANRMKSEFLATMSHELRTPLNAIIGFADAMKTGLTGEMTAQQREYLGDILSSGEHLLSLINDILDLSKIEAGKLELKLDEFDIVPLLQTSLMVIKDRAAKRGITIEFSADVEGSIQADRRLLRQIVYNLLSNAEKFTPDEGRVSLTVRRVPGAVLAERKSVVGLNERSSLVEHYLEVAVTDTGIGMSENDKEHLFQPFVQLDSSLSRQYEGTGLGLALVKRLVLLHDGFLAVDSQVGVGSVFTVWLPYHKEFAAPFVPARDSSVAQPEAPVALIVEDDPVTADMIAQYLEKEGLQAVQVSTGEDGLEKVRTLHPRLITLDLKLPGMDGWQFLQTIKQDPATSEIPIVIISMADDAKKGIALGAMAVLQKPIDEIELAKIVADLNLPYQGESAVVLVVDDDPRAVEILSLQLEASHYKVLRAYSGREAIAIALCSAVDMIILDLMMPELSGFDVIDALQSKSQTACIPVIVVTAKSVTEEDLTTLNGYVLRIIEKSDFTGDVFINEVHRALLAFWHAGPDAGDVPRIGSWL